MSKPKFDPNRPFTVGEKPKFDPNRPYTTDDATEIDSALRGVAQGASFGFADEITGGLESLFTDKSYEQARDESRANYKAAENANPKSYMTGEIGGAIASSFIPGLGLAKGATLAANVGKMGALGAATGLGASDSDLTKGDYSGAAKDAAIGAALGAGSEYGLSKAGPLVKKATGKIGDVLEGSLKKLGSTVAGVPEEVSDRYLKRSSQIDSVPKYDELYEYLSENVLPDFKREHLGKNSAQAWETLSSYPIIPKEDVINAGEAEINKIIKGSKGNLSRTAGVGADADRIRAIQQQLAEIEQAHGSHVAETDLKAIVKNLQDLGWSYKGEPKTSISGETLQDLSGVYNEFLKTRNPAYQEAMVPVAEQTNALKQVEKAFLNRAENNEQFLKAAPKFYKQDNNSDLLKALDRISKDTGSDFTNMLLDRNAKDAFEKASTNGSRKAVVGAVLGSGAGPLGASIGTTAGAIADSYGGQIYKNLLKGQIKITDLKNKVSPKFFSVLENASKRGSDSLAATHLILLQNPEYRKSFDDKKE